MAEREAVVLVHGLWMHGMVMTWMAQRLAQAGYAPHTYSYPSVRIGIAENARRLAHYCQALGVHRLHLLGHSLGGLLALRALELLRGAGGGFNSGGLEVGRVVVMGSPYADSAAARHLARFNVGRAAIGASMAEWLEGLRPTDLAHHDIGVIAGSYELGLGALLIPGLARPNDGAVSLAETRVPGARDHIVVNVSHSGLVLSPAVVREVSAFFADGAFSRGAARYPPA